MLPQASYTVYLLVIDQKFVDRGVAGIKGSFDKFKAKGKVTPEVDDAALAKLIPTVDLETAVKNTDFIIEAVPEKMEIKKAAFAELDKYSPKHAILASNTSTMSITEISKATKRLENVIGYHFFNPAILMKLVEVIRNDKFSDEAIQIGNELARKIKKVPVIVKKDSPGFICSRVNATSGALINKIVEAGTPTPEEFDGAMKAFMPITPFELSDYFGNDVNLNGLQYMSQVLSPEYKLCDAFVNMINAGKLGKKTGKGLYDWSQGRNTIDLSKATKEYDLNPLIALQVNEDTKLLEEGVCNDPKEIDLAMANCGGAPFGPFGLSQSIGYPALIPS